MGRTTTPLTATEVENARLEPGQRERELSDGGNLKLIVGKSSKTWLVRYSWAGKRDKLPLGPYGPPPGLSLAAARAKCAEIMALVAAGENPKAVKERAAAVAHAEALIEGAGGVPRTVAELFERWRTDYLAKHHSDGGDLVAGLFNNHILPVIGELQLDLWRRTHVILLLDKIYATGKHRTAGMALTNLRQMVMFGAGHEWIDRDPTLGLKPETWEGRAKECDRYLTRDELKMLVKVMGAEREDGWALPKWAQHALLLILATGTRVGETLLTEKKHLLDDYERWFIPKENQKKRRGVTPVDFTIWLSSFAAEQMRALVELSSSKKYVFAARRTADVGPEKPIEEKALTRMLRDRQRPGEIKGRKKSADVYQFPNGAITPHDLRRTTATIMGDQKIDPHVIDRCLNHVQGKIQRIYQLSRRDDERAAAWDAVGAQLDAVVAEARAELKAEKKMKGKKDGNGKVRARK